MHTRLARAIAGAAVSIGLLIGGVTPQLAAASTEVTATESLNVRSAPSTTATIIGSLYRGQTVTALSAADGWTKITYAHSSAYVASRYLSPGANLRTMGQVGVGAPKTTTTDVNLRKGPGMSYGLIKILPKGTRVTLTGKVARGYTEVINGASTGWIGSQYLTSAADGLPAIIGTRIATTALAIRTTSGADAQTVAVVKEGTRLSVTGATANGRAQIVYNKAVRWVTAKYLANPSTTQPSPPTLPRVTGYRYTTTTLDIRSSSSDSYTRIAEVPRGTRLDITGVVTNGRMQIVYNNSVRWVTASYLSTTQPGGTTPGSFEVEKGLQPNAIKVHRAAMDRFPQITTYYGVRPDSIPDHPSGRALDLMLPDYSSASGRALGYEVSRWAQANASTLGIQYVIYDQQIWNVARNADGWRFMADRGSDSANHKNHVHITVF